VKRYLQLLGSAFLLGVTVASGGCAVVDVARPVPLKLDSRWTLLPVQDHSETSQAGERVEETLSTLMRTQLNVELAKYPTPSPSKSGDSDTEVDDRQRYEQALSSARKEGFAYGLGGSVTEWRYRSGADGEAAVGLTVSLVDIASGRTLWSASGSRAGWGRETASGTAQKLLRQLLKGLSAKP
jgi:hypothetical protein